MACVSAFGISGIQACIDQPYFILVSFHCTLIVDRVMNNFSVWSFFLSRQTQKAQTEQEDQVSYVTPGGHLGSACS